MYELEDVRLRLLPARDLDEVRDALVALREARRIARVYPEDPRFLRVVSSAVSMLDCELRLSAVPQCCPRYKCWIPLPYAAEPNQRGARSWPRAVISKLLERAPLYEVIITAEWYDDRWVWGSLSPF